MLQDSEIVEVVHEPPHHKDESLHLADDLISQIDVFNLGTFLLLATIYRARKHLRLELIFQLVGPRLILHNSIGLVIDASLVSLRPHVLFVGGAELLAEDFAYYKNGMRFTRQLLSQQNQDLELHIVEVSLDRSFELLGLVQLLMRLFCFILFKSFYQLIKRSLKFHSALIHLFLIILEFLHEVVEPFGDSLQVVQPKYFIKFLKSDLLPLFVDFVAGV